MTTDLVGKRLGDFDVVRQIGRGGMGVVYEARQVSLNRRVALKVLAGGLGLTPRAVDRFRREAEAAARLHHTHIVPVYATGEQDGVHFYAMELIDGPSLDRVIRQLRGDAPADPLPADLMAATGPYVEGAAPAAASGSGLSSGGAYFDTVAKMIADVADALDHAHKNGVLHRDVKPANLLLAADGRLSVNDFGLARVLEEPGMTVTGEFVGTPAYMSPEQVTAGRVPVDHRTDVYSLGATLYELLTLRPPFVADRRDQLLGMVVQKDPVPPRKVNPTVPVDLETICLKAMDKDPDRRYATAKDLADDLRRYANRFAIAARRAGPVTKLRKWARRNPGLAAAGVVALLALGLAGVFAWQSHRAEQRRIEAEADAERKLVEERRQNALDTAATAALAGDLEAAERALDEAQRHGASEGQLRTYRGQVALLRGDPDEAVLHLTIAAERQPDSVAARAALAAALRAAGQWPEFVRTRDATRQMPAVTPEDHLWKGFVLRNAEGLEALDEAVRLRPGMRIARLVRAEVLAHTAQDTADPAYGERAIADAAFTKQLLPGNPAANWISLYAHLTTAGAYGQRGQEERRLEVLAAAEPDARALAGLTHPGNGVGYRWIYLLEVGRDDDLLADSGRPAEELPGFLHFLRATVLYRRGQVGPALAVLDRQPKPGIDDFRCLVLAERDGHPGRALEECRRLTADTTYGTRLLRVAAMFRCLGDAPAAVEIGRQIRHRPDQFEMISPFMARVAEFYAGELGEDQFVTAAGSSRLNLVQAHYHIAMAKLGDGDRAAAQQHFRQTLATKAIDYRTGYFAARAILGRMEQDPTWPPWIPAKK